MSGEAVLIRHTVHPCRGSMHGVHLSASPSQKVRKLHSPILNSIPDLRNDFLTVTSSGFS